MDAKQIAEQKAKNEAQAADWRKVTQPAGNTVAERLVSQDAGVAAWNAKYGPVPATFKPMDVAAYAAEHNLEVIVSLDDLRVRHQYLAAPPGVVGAPEDSGFGKQIGTHGTGFKHDYFIFREKAEGSGSMTGGAGVKPVLSGTWGQYVAGTGPHHGYTADRTLMHNARVPAALAEEFTKAWAEWHKGQK